MCVADKITCYPQWTWPKWVVPYRLWMFSHKFEHPMSAYSYFFARASQRISYDFLIWKMGKWWFISQLWGRYVAYIRTPRVWTNQNHHLLRYQKAQAVKIMKVTDKNYANGRRCKQWAPLISRHWCGFRYWIFVCHNSTSSKHRTFFLTPLTLINSLLLWPVVQLSHWTWW